MSQNELWWPSRRRTSRSWKRAQNIDCAIEFTCRIRRFLVRLAAAAGPVTIMKIAMEATKAWASQDGAKTAYQDGPASLAVSVTPGRMMLEKLRVPLGLRSSKASILASCITKKRIREVRGAARGSWVRRGRAGGRRAQITAGNGPATAASESSWDRQGSSRTHQHPHKD